MESCIKTGTVKRRLLPNWNLSVDTSFSGYYPVRTTCIDTLFIMMILRQCEPSRVQFLFNPIRRHCEFTTFVGRFTAKT